MTPGEPSVACTDCREAIAAEPAADITADWATAAVRAHLEGCDNCRAWLAEMCALEVDIARALAVPVPPLDLPALSRGDVRALATTTGGRRSRRTAGWLALAASVVVAVVLGWRLTGDDVAARALGEQVLAHIDHEAFSLVISDAAVSGERLARVVPADVALLGPDTGLVTYAQSCVINGRTVPHLVVQGEHGPVTILLMPHESIDGPERIGNGVLTGVLLPVGEGSIAIVGQDAADLERFERTMKNAVTWQT